MRRTYNTFSRPVDKEDISIALHSAFVGNISVLNQRLRSWRSFLEANRDSPLESITLTHQV
jgi:hypothetical protein